MVLGVGGCIILISKSFSILCGKSLGGSVERRGKGGGELEQESERNSKKGRKQPAVLI